MNISVRQVQAKVPVTIMKLDGELDAGCYVDVIQEAYNLYQDETRDLLIDMGGLNFMASSGLVALHSIALIMRGEKPPEMSASWDTFRAVRTQAEHETEYEVHCKLLSPQPRVESTLKMAGFSEIFEIFTDEDSAVASFG